MTTYNPYQSRERHRRAKPRQGMTAADFLRCMGATLGLVVILWAAAFM